MERVIEQNLAFRKAAETIEKDFPSLHYVEIDNAVPAVAGDLVLLDEVGGVLDTYQIVIKETQLFPKRFPFVYEVGGRIPHNIDWHVFNDGHCCIKSIPEEILLCKGGMSLPTFVREQVVPYFFNQKHREMHGFFLHERSHGLRGNIEFFEDLFGTKDAQTILQWLLFIKKRREPNRVNECFCGSGRKYRKCHREVYRKISGYTDEELNWFINMVLRSRP